MYIALSPPPPLLADVPFSPLVLDRHDGLLRMALSEDEKYRERVLLSRVPPHVVQAVLLYEDQHFYRHPGVDVLALMRASWSALWASVSGTRRTGGSTIAMQVARLRYGLLTTTVRGKLQQMLLALRLTYHHGREQVLEAYFNLAPYGGNVEGVGAAARVFFHRPVEKLTEVQGLALAVVPQNPGKRGLVQQGQGKELTTARMLLHRRWNEQKTDSTVPHSPPALRLFGLADLPFAAPHVSTELLAAKRGARSTAIATTIDRKVQALLERALQHFAGRGRLYGLNNAAALLLHWPSMEIRALAGSADFHAAAIAGQVDGTRARRSPGSTLKPFIYALALDQGLIHPRTLLIDAPRSFGGYDPENFDRRFRGPLAAEEALRASRNIPAIWLASRLRPDLYGFLKRAGVALERDAEHYGLSLVLGGAEVTMRELASLYALLPNGGVWRQPQLIRATTTRPTAGVRAQAVAAPLPEAASEDRIEPGAVSLLSPEAAFVTLRMLEETWRQVRTHKGNLPLRYKTGTSNRFRDAWCAGLVGPYVLVVWVGNFDNSSNPLLVGGEVAAPLFEDVARALALAERLEDEALRGQEALNVIRLPVCAETGDLDTSLCAETLDTWFIPGRSPTRDSTVYRRIWVDQVSGLRLCRPETQGKEIVWEFWPSELRQLFARAGIHKAPPPALAQPCGETEPDGSDIWHKTWPNTSADSMRDSMPGQAPRILSPKEGLSYQRSVSGQGRNTIALHASLDADADTVHWFAGDRFLGSSTGDTPLLWEAPSGTHSLRAVDNWGRTSLRTLVVHSVP